MINLALVYGGADDKKEKKDICLLYTSTYKSHIIMAGKMLSKYNRYIFQGEKLYIYNLLSRGLICLDDKLLIEPIKEQRLGDLGEGLSLIHI